MDNKCFELGANEQPLDIIKETCGFAGIFKQIGVIGDSLASGEFESHDENGSKFIPICTSIRGPLFWSALRGRSTTIILAAE